MFAITLASFYTPKRETRVPQFCVLVTLFWCTNSNFINSQKRIKIKNTTARKTAPEPPTILYSTADSTTSTSRISKPPPPSTCYKSNTKNSSNWEHEPTVSLKITPSTRSQTSYKIHKSSTVRKIANTRTSTFPSNSSTCWKSSQNET